MKLSQFHGLLRDEFGEGLSSVLLRDTRLTEFAEDLYSGGERFGVKARKDLGSGFDEFGI